MNPLPIPVLLVLAAVAWLIAWKFIKFGLKLVHALFVYVCIDNQATPEVQAQQREKAEKEFEKFVESPRFIHPAAPWGWY